MTGLDTAGRRGLPGLSYPERYLHDRLVDNPALLRSIGMSSPRRQVALAGGSPLQTLSMFDLYAYLCVPGASSAWFRLKWLVDFTALLMRQAPGSTNELVARSVRLGAGRAMGQALLLSHDLLGLPLPQETVTTLLSRLNGLRNGFPRETDDRRQCAVERGLYGEAWRGWRGLSAGAGEVFEHQVWRPERTCGLPRPRRHRKPPVLASKRPR